MKLKPAQTQRIVSLVVLLGLVGILVLSACSGQALINFTYNPTTGAGSGNIQITGPAPEATSSGGGGGGGGATSQLVLFAVVVALLIGTLAVVVASSRRRRLE